MALTEKLNEYILTIQDDFTMYSLAIPLPNSLASTIADVLANKFICIFISNLIRRMAKIFKIRPFKTTASHPQSNGSLERSHHVLAECLKQFVSKSSEWDDWIELATFSYNTSIHEGTCYTPYELVFSKLARQPSSEPLPEDEKLETYDDYLIKLVTRLHEIRAIARDNLIAAKKKLKKYYDRKISSQNFNVDEEVFLLSGPKPKKLENQYSGPYKILEVLEKGNVKIQIENKPKVVHINWLKRAQLNKED